MLHAHESCEASPRTKCEDLGAGTARKEDKMSIHARVPSPEATGEKVCALLKRYT